MTPLYRNQKLSVITFASTRVCVLFCFSKFKFWLEEDTFKSGKSCSSDFSEIRLVEILIYSVGDFDSYKKNLFSTHSSSV